jgi:inner membrane protein
MAEAGLRRRTAWATTTLVLGANLPDLDALSTLSQDALGFRRGWTHGVLAMVVLPLLLTAAILLWVRNRGPGSGDTAVRPVAIWGLATIAVLSHPLLDWLNSYGVRLLMPFSGRWFYGDALFIVDPWVWLVLGGGVVLSSRRRGRRHAHPEVPARVALGAGLGYAVAMLGLSVAGRSVAAAATGGERPVGARTLMIEPQWLVPSLRAVVVDGGDRYRFGDIEWLPRPKLRMRNGSLPKQFDDPRAHKVAFTDQARQLLDWARFPYYAFELRDGVSTLRIDDARYSRGGASWAGITLPLAP